MSHARQTGFEHCALVSGLLTQEQLDEAWRVLRAKPAQQLDEVPIEERLAQQLVELGYLNPWQAKQLLEGRTKFTLGTYKIVDSIGRGGMGQVFKGEHTLLGRVVAVKVLPRHKSSPQAVESFLREIRAQARLDHPNLVRAYDAGVDGNVVYLVTEYVPGVDLRKLIRQRGPLRMHAAASIISQVASALQHAHEQGLIHRDVKPGNILVTTEGQAKLLDLGLAGPLGQEAVNDPRYGRIVGTVDYLSPDHIREPHNPTPAWDIYSLGCTLYYAVTGKVPFPGGTTGDKLRAHCELKPLDPRRLNPELSAGFVDVMADMMAKDPRERISTAAEVVKRLRPWAPGPYPLDETCFLRSQTQRSRRKLYVARPIPVEAVALPETKPNFSSPLIEWSGESEATSLSQASRRTDELSVPPGSDVPLDRQIHGQTLLGPLVLFLLIPAVLVSLVFLLWSLFGR
ncbi:MAG: serine/threonine-protein kinase [Thermogutta sp.]